MWPTAQAGGGIWDQLENVRGRELASSFPPVEGPWVRSICDLNPGRVAEFMACERNQTLIAAYRGRGVLCSAHVNPPPPLQGGVINLSIPRVCDPGRVSDPGLTLRDPFGVGKQNARRFMYRPSVHRPLRIVSSAKLVDGFPACPAIAPSGAPHSRHAVRSNNQSQIVIPWKVGV